MEDDSEGGTAVPGSGAEPGSDARADRVKEAIRQIGNARDLARLSGVAYGTIQNYSQGGEMKLSNAVAIARAAGVRLEWLATGEGPMVASQAGALEAGGELAGDDIPGIPPVSGMAEGLSARHISAHGGALGLAWQANPDRLAQAYEQALRGIAVLPGRAPDPRRLMQVTLLIYDELTDAEVPAEKPPGTP